MFIGTQVAHVLVCPKSNAVSDSLPLQKSRQLFTDLDESQNWSLGKVGVRVPHSPRGYANEGTL